MGLILDFLFGRDPDIFDDHGNVVHKHPKKKWEAWANKMKNDPHYNWRNHTGTRAGENSGTTKKSDSKSN